MSIISKIVEATVNNQWDSEVTQVADALTNVKSRNDIFGIIIGNSGLEFPAAGSVDFKDLSQDHKDTLNFAGQVAKKLGY